MPSAMESLEGDFWNFPSLKMSRIKTVNLCGRRIDVENFFVAVRVPIHRRIFNEVIADGDNQISPFNRALNIISRLQTQCADL